MSLQLSVGSGPTPDLLAALLLRLRVLAVSVASEALPRTWDLASGRSGSGGKALCFCSVAVAVGGAAELLAAAGSLASASSPRESFLAAARSFPNFSSSSCSSRRIAFRASSLFHLFHSGLGDPSVVLRLLLAGDLLSEDLGLSPSFGLSGVLLLASKAPG